MRNVKVNQIDEEFFNNESREILPNVEHILSDVQRNKDNALQKYTLEFDKVEIDCFKISEQEINNAYHKVNKKLIADIKESINRLERFSAKQLESYRNFEEEIEKGVLAGQRIIPINRVGVYVPGGRFPLISSVFMGVVPAKVAGVKEVIVCSPPTYNGTLHPAILVSADISGVEAIYRVGGVQAIGAMAYGTQSIKKVNKIVGPGNAYVTSAKKFVFGKVGIDFIAGPTEILIIADESANPSFVAADLIGQAEHDLDAGPILVTTSSVLAQRVLAEVEEQLNGLSTEKIARESLTKNGIIVLVDTLEQAADFANDRAPEHLEIQLENVDKIIPKLTNYGSLFIGAYTAEVLGDYSSGLNHVLPTHFAAKYTGGLSVKDFIKIQTTLRVTEHGLRKIGPASHLIAKAEGLDGHAFSVGVRLKDIS